jgi:hypothetical protein
MQFISAHCLNHRPETPEELFNLRHSSVRTIIERIFGIMKRRWRVLTIPLEISVHCQAMLVPALCAVHNFIRIVDPEELECEFPDIMQSYSDSDWSNLSELTNYLANTAATRTAVEDIRDSIAQAMWAQYQTYRDGLT